MDVLNLATGDVAKFEEAQFREAELEIRRQLAETRLDIYSTPSVNAGKVRKLKKNLARLLTVRNEKRRSAKQA